MIQLKFKLDVHVYNLHRRCVPLDDSIRHVTDMVHGRCDCRHNTTGLNCQFCKDTHNDLPWKPAIGRLLNACKSKYI